MASQLQALRLALCQACSSQEQPVQGGQTQGMGSAVSDLFDLVAVLCPAELLDMAQKLPPPMLPHVASTTGTRSKSSSSSSSSSSRSDTGNGGLAWACQLLTKAADLLLEEPSGLTWQAALQGRAGTGEWCLQWPAVCYCVKMFVALLVAIILTDRVMACIQLVDIIPGSRHLVQEAAVHHKLRVPALCLSLSLSPTGALPRSMLAAQLCELLGKSGADSTTTTSNSSSNSSSPAAGGPGGTPPAFTLAQLGRVLRWKMHMVGGNLENSLGRAGALQAQPSKHPRSFQASKFHSALRL
jgi:hypothetical protein